MKRLIKILLRTLLIVFIFINIVTAFHAYKFTHFYNAGDITVKQEENGWDKTGNILFGIDVAKKPNSITRKMSIKAITHTFNIGDGRTITLETGKLAKQADGAVVVVGPERECGREKK